MRITPTINVRNEAEWEFMVETQDFQISKNIIDSIWYYQDKKQDLITLFTVKMEDEGIILDFELERKDFSKTIKENLKHYEAQDYYEECAKLVELCNKLDNQ